MSETNSKTDRIKGKWLLRTAAVGLAGAACILALRAPTAPHVEYWKNLWEQATAYLTARPWAPILALAVLPGIGFPVSPLLVLFGLALAPRYGLALTCLIGVAAHSFCSIWTYFLAAGPLRSLLQKTLLKKRVVPKFTQADAIRIAFMVRIAPGFPYFVQNILLGVGGLALGPYLAVSVPTTSLYTVGFIVMGEALFEGHTGLVLTVFSLILLVVLGRRICLKRMKIATHAE